MYQGAAVRLQGSSLGHSLWKGLRESFRRVADSLAQAERAIQVGKALDQLQGRLAWSGAIRNAAMEIHPESQAGADIVVSLVMSTPLTVEEVSLLGETLAQVNNRFRLRIRLDIQKRGEEDVKQGTLIVKKP